MALPTGGRWIFSVDTTSGFSGLVLGLNNGVAPVFPTPQGGAFNIEVFTNATVSGQAGIPNPETGFQSSIADAGGTLDNGFLTGTTLRLGSGNFLAVNRIPSHRRKAPPNIILGAGNQTVVGATFDTLIGGQAPAPAQILSALLGNQTVVGGAHRSHASIWGGAPRLDRRPAPAPTSRSSPCTRSRRSWSA